jgi:hypothetical protein
MANQKAQSSLRETGFSPSDLAVEALGSLKEREAEIIRLRLGLSKSGKRLTLEEIGRTFGITRERVRQLEQEAIKHLAKNPTRRLKQFFEEFKEFVSERGGIVNLKEAWNFFHPASESEPPLLEESSLRLLLHADPHLASLKNLAGEEDNFYLPKNISLDRIKSLLDKIKEVLERAKTPLAFEEIAKRAGESSRVVRGLLVTSELFGQTRDGRYGLKDWPEISPRCIRDKIYLIMKEAGRPLHFKQIAENISDAGLSKRPVLARTVHNELIYDNRFVLIGRGIYALQEWGYQPGVVADVIKKVLQKANKPLKTKEIIEEVLKERQVKRNTIVANLQNKMLFKKAGKALYTLAE